MAIPCGPTWQLAEWINKVDRSRTAELSADAQEAFADFLACLVGGASDPAALRVATVARDMGPDGKCTIIGDKTGQKVSAAAAAFANGYSGHILDFDDSLEPLQGHLTTTVVPAALAIVEDRSLSGAELLDAIVVGVEIACIVGRASRDVFVKGWHNTSVIGVIAATASCCRLLRLGTREICSAIGIAVSSAAGHMGQNGYTVKPLQPAFAARDGVIAAYLAEAGIEGNPETLTGSLGFSNLYGNKRDNSTEYVIPSDTQALAIVHPGLIYKPYASCGDMHRSIDACLDIVETHDIRPEDIASITTILPFISARNLPHKVPTTSNQARFSLPYNIAVAVIYRAIRLVDYDEEQLNRRSVLDFIPRVELQVIPGSEAEFDRTHLDYTIETLVITNSGKEYRDSRKIRKGDRRLPLSKEEQECKMKDCFARTLSETSANRARELVNKISVLANLSELMALLV